MCFRIIFENLTQTRKHRLIDLLLTGLAQCEFHYISSHLPKSLKKLCNELTIQYCSVMMKTLPISWRGDAILAKICWKTCPLELA